MQHTHTHVQYFATRDRFPSLNQLHVLKMDYYLLNYNQQQKILSTKNMLFLTYYSKIIIINFIIIYNMIINFGSNIELASRHQKT